MASASLDKIVFAFHFFDTLFVLKSSTVAREMHQLQSILVSTGRYNIMLTIQLGNNCIMPPMTMMILEK